jgi:hypothetical protein
LWIDRQPEVKEESITDWSLDWLSQQTKRLAYRLFTRHEEARTTGADWEWWIIGRKRSFKARMQAKKLKPNADNHSSLAKTNVHGLQILKLIQGAQAADAAPLYMFYAAAAIISAKPLTICGMHISDASRIDAQFVSVARRHVSQDDVLQSSVPLPMVFCRPQSTKPTPGPLDTLVRFIWSEREPQNQTIQDQVGDLDDQPGIRHGIPRHVLTFLQDAGSRRLQQAWFLDSFRGVEAVFVTDLRPKE